MLLNTKENKKIKIDNKEPVKFIAGTKYIREFQGKKYEVTAISDGYCYNGKVYKSLSAIANEITGTRWNGKRFLELNKIYICPFLTYLFVNLLILGL